MSSSRDVLLGSLLLLILAAGNASADPREFSSASPTPPDTVQAPPSFSHVLGGSAGSALLYGIGGLALGAGLGALTSDGGEWSGLGVVVFGFLGAGAGGILGAGSGAHAANGSRGNHGLTMASSLAAGGTLFVQGVRREDSGMLLLSLPAAILTATLVERATTPSAPAVQVGMWRADSGPVGPAVSLRF